MEQVVKERLIRTEQQHSALTKLVRLDEAIMYAFEGELVVAVQAAPN